MKQIDQMALSIKLLADGAGHTFLEKFIACWDGLDDPRTGNASLHDLHEILAIAMCAVLCGGQGSVDMGLFAKSKEPFLRGFLKLDNGVPSHDTFSRLFRGSWRGFPSNAKASWP